MNRRTFLALATTLPAAVEAAAFAAKQSPADYLEEIIRDGTVPGAALVTSRRGRIKLRKVVGTFCRVDRRDAPLTLTTMHPLYSFSKLITATVVAMTVTEGKLNYGDLVSKHIPEFTGGGKDVITIRHCLTHSAGLAKVQSKSVRDAAGWQQALQNLCTATVEWSPGSRTAYHGWSGAFLAGECVRRVNGGASWAELCREKLFARLGADSLSFETPKNDAEVAVVPQPAADKPLPQSADAAFGYAGQPGAGCFGTLDDALKILNLHLQQGVWKGKRLIAREVSQEMHTVQYAHEIESALAAGAPPAQESWGLGPLLRGKGPANGGIQWFGFAHQTEPRVFGHAGIDTLIGVGDPATHGAFVFVTTHSPKSSEKTILLRNRMCDEVLNQL